MIKILKSEYLKIIYNKWLLSSTLLTIVLVPIFIIYLHENPSEITKKYVLSQILESYYLGQSGIIIITILNIGQEFTKSTLRTSAIFCPNRVKFLFSKLFALISLMLLIWGAIAVVSILVVKTYYGLILFKDILVLTMNVSIVSLSLVLICFSLVILTKSLVFSLGISLSFLLGLGQILLQFSKFLLYFPILSTMNTFLLVDSPVFLSSSHGIIVQNLWAMFMLALSSYIFVRRGIR